jgi:hypothetical protein
MDTYFAATAVGRSADAQVARPGSCLGRCAGGKIES